LQSQTATTQHRPLSRLRSARPHSGSKKPPKHLIKWSPELASRSACERASPVGFPGMNIRAFHAMNSRRSMGLPRAEGHAGHGEEYHNSERIIPKATQWGSRSCPLWVKKRTLRPKISMSALPPKADIRRRDWDVRFVPQADSCTAAKMLGSQFVGHSGLLEGSRQLIGRSRESAT
jgi:hypothetical protein